MFLGGDAALTEVFLTQAVNIKIMNAVYLYVLI
jgi:hypothetical protein